MTDIEQAQLWEVLSGPAPDGGLWNGRKVADWLSQLSGKKISRYRGWEILKSMSFRLRVPRPKRKRSGGRIRATRVEKKLHFELEVKQVQYPAAEIKLWCMDEHRIGLPTVNTEIFNLVLADVAKEFDLSENKRILLAHIRQPHR